MTSLAKLGIGLGAALVLSLPATPTKTSAAVVDCEAARCAVQSALQQRCPCGDPQFTNHGRYVSCVARALRELVSAGAVPRECRGRIQRCVARSTCNKPAGFVTCTVPTAFGTCDSVSGTCTAGTSSSGTCTADTDCVVATRCTIKSSADRCIAPGAVVGSGSCCASCSP